MKRNLRIILLFTVLIFSFTGCTKKEESAPQRYDGGGIGVGNGRTENTPVTYISPYGFSLRYHPDLSLTKSVKETLVKIDNSKLASDPGVRSSIELKITPKMPEKNLPPIAGGGPASPWEELKLQAATEHPDVSFKEVEFPGAKALAWSNESDQHLLAYYYILTAQNEIVVATLDAKSQGQGIAIVAPIVKTLIFDETAPIIKAISFFNLNGSELIAGNSTKLYFQASDDLSGLSPRVSLRMYVDQKNYREAEIDLDNVPFVEAPEKGANWYSVLVPIGRWKPSAVFYLHSFTLKDRTGNTRELSVALKDGEPLIEDGLADSSSRKDQPKLPKVTCRIKNLGKVDVTAPRITGAGYAIREPDVKGQPFKRSVYLTIIDDESQVMDFDPHSTEPPQEVQGEFFRMTDERLFRIPFRGELIRLATPNHYEVEVTFKKGLPSGDYILSLVRVTDRAGNRGELSFYNKKATRRFYGYEDGKYGNSYPTTVQLKAIPLRNAGFEDSVGPEILEFDLLKPLAAGAKGELIFHAKDKSGINLLKCAENWATGYASCGEFVLESNSRATNRIILGNEIRAIKDRPDWYAIAFEVPPMLKPGRYFLDFLTVFDQEDNFTYLGNHIHFGEPLTQTRFDLWDGHQNDIEFEKGVEIPFLQILPETK